MRFLPRAIPVGGLGLAVSLSVAACGGGSGLLSSDQSNSINGQLSQISSALQSGDCSTVSKTSVSLAHAVAQLPATVNPTLRQNLDQGVSTVGQLANRECKPAAATTTTTTTSTTTTPTTTTTNTTTPAQTTPTTSTQSPPSSTSTTPPATTPPSTGTTSTGSGGAGLGSGGGNSQGGGGAAAGPAGAVAPGPPGGASTDKATSGGTGR